MLVLMTIPAVQGKLIGQGMSEDAYLAFAAKARDMQLIAAAIYVSRPSCANLKSSDIDLETDDGFGCALYQPSVVDLGRASAELDYTWWRSATTHLKAIIFRAQCDRLVR
jgi:hypothetical protein